MKHVYIIVILIMSHPVCVFSQSTNEQNVRETLDEVAAALRSNNTVPLDKLYASDYISVGIRGDLITKESRLESIKSGRLKYESYDYENVKVRLYGNTAVAIATIKVKIKGQEDNTVLSTLVLAKNGDQWQIVNAQTTNIFQ